jgi:hypothetical protein
MIKEAAAMLATIPTQNPQFIWLIAAVRRDMPTITAKIHHIAAETEREARRSGAGSRLFLCRPYPSGGGSMSKVSLADSTCRIQQAQEVLSLWLEATNKNSGQLTIGAIISFRMVSPNDGFSRG